MRTLRSLAGMPVVCHRRRIGRLLRAELSEDLRRLVGIWVGTGLRGTRWISVEDLQILGEAAILADSCGVRKPMRCAPLFRRAVSTDGARLGVITGADIDTLSFTVASLELSLGFWEDIAHRRLRVTRYTTNRQTGEIVIDPAEQEKEGCIHEGRHDQGTDDRHADRLGSRDGFRRDELADGAEMEPEGPADRELGFRPNG